MNKTIALDNRFILLVRKRETYSVFRTSPSIKTTYSIKRTPFKMDLSAQCRKFKKMQETNKTKMEIRRIKYLDHLKKIDEARKKRVFLRDALANEDWPNGGVVSWEYRFGYSLTQKKIYHVKENNLEYTVVLGSNRNGDEGLIVLKKKCGTVTFFHPEGGTELLKNPVYFSQKLLVSEMVGVFMMEDI